MTQYALQKISRIQIQLKLKASLLCINTSVSSDLMLGNWYSVSLLIYNSKSANTQQFTATVVCQTLVSFFHKCIKL